MTEEREGTSRIGRPPKMPGYKRLNVNVSIYQPHLQKLERWAARRGTNVSEVVRALIEETTQGPSGIRRDG